MVYFISIHFLQNIFRQKITKIVLNPWFDRFIITVIALNSIILALADYGAVDSEGQLVEKGSVRNTLLAQSDVVFTAIFTVELILKSISLGFIGSPTSYISDSWNWLDIIVVISGLVVSL